MQASSGAYKLYSAVQTAGIAMSAKNANSFFHDLGCCVLDAASIPAIALCDRDCIFPPCKNIRYQAWTPPGIINSPYNNRAGLANISLQAPENLLKALRGTG
jgi:hypothetical protein